MSPVTLPRSSAARPLRVGVAVLLFGSALSCARTLPLPDPLLAPFEDEDRIEIPQRPADEGGLIAVGALTHTVRPERRAFDDSMLRLLRTPQGFEVGVFERGLINPRILHVTEQGHLYVTEREAGRVRLLRDTNGDGRADVSRVVASGLGEGLGGVHGLASRGGRLYLVTVNELYVADIQANGGLGAPTRVIDDLPDGGQHPNRTMAFGPDGMLYLSIGSQTNGIPEHDPETAALLRVNPDTWQREVWAEGLRNTIGFGWHPVTGELWGLDHNTDHRGDDWPPEELNRIVQGRHYGWPWCGGNRQVDWQVPSGPEEGTREAFCARTEAPALTYVAHAAPMQMTFYGAEHFPADFRGDAFVAMRGSWNRNPPIGYEVVRIRYDASGQPASMESFVSGWLIEGGQAHFGRLTGLVVAPDGGLLVADDDNGVIYRIHYTGD